MSLTFKVEPKKDWLLVIFSGSYDSSMAEEFTNQVLAVCTTHKPAKLLIDMREVEGEMSKMSRYGLAMTAATKYFLALFLGKVAKCRFAIVGNHPLVDPDKFEEVVANYRKFDMKIFTEIKKAYVWLGVEPGEQS